MKKIISVLLALLCLFTALSTAVYADDAITDMIEDEFGLEIEDPKAYGIVYNGGDAQTMYMPATTVVFDAPGYAKVPSDYPIAIGKKFVRWEDKDGNRVYPGDEIYVGTIVYLTAIWSNSSSNVKALDTIICALKTSIHAIQIALKLIDTAHSYRAA